MLDLILIGFLHINLRFETEIVIKQRYYIKKVTHIQEGFHELQYIRRETSIKNMKCCFFIMM